MSKAPEKTKKPAPETEAVEKTAASDVASAEKPDALESFLNRSQDSEKPAKAALKKQKLSRGSIALIIAIAVVAVLICVIIFIVNQSVTGNSDAMIRSQAEIATTVDEKGEHHVEVSTDESGEIQQNGYGSLVSYVPSQISRIEVENTSGSFTVNAVTPEGEATVYTITGFEGYDLRPGMADAVANDAAALSFSSIAAVGGNLADFGLDKPRAVAKVTYTDGTSAEIRVGSVADGGAGTYVTLGDSDEIFLVADDAVDSFLYGVLEMISYDISSRAESVADSEFSVIKLTGARYPDPITLVPDTDKEFKANYRLTSPYEMFADNYEGNDISGSIRDLYAESVVCVNPSSGQLSSFGVADPYAQVYAVYPDTAISLACSAPTDDGLVNLYNPDKGIIYTIRLDALGWANTDVEQLLPKTVIELDRTYVSHITVNSGGKSYSLDVSTAKTAEGEEAEVEITKATLGGKQLPQESFLIFFQNFNGMKNLGLPSGSGADVIYEWTVSYETDRGDDVISIYDSGDKSCPVAFNGVPIGSVSKSHVSSLQQDIVDLQNGKTPKSL